MSDDHIESAAAVQQDADDALRGFALEKGADQPVFVARADAGVLPRLIFANRPMQALFGMADLGALGGRIFSAADPGAKRLALLAGRSGGNGPRLERLRFYFGAVAYVFTFACHWLQRKDGPVFAAMILDAPANLLGRAVAVTAAEAPEKPLVAAAAAPDVEPPREPKAVRFLWRTDAEDRFTEVTPPLAEIVGQASSDFVGRRVQQVIDMLSLDPHGALAKAFARRETWSGIEVLWPIAGTSTAVAVGLGGLPAFGRSRQFEGYHGFGVIYADRIVSQPQGVAGPEVLPPEPPKVEEAGFFTNVVRLRPNASTPRAPSSGPAAAPPVEAAEPVMEDRAPDRVSQEPAEEPVAEELIAEDSVLQKFPQEAELQEANLQQAEPAPVPAGEADEAVLDPSEPQKDLSTDEQKAFHEIGRALTTDGAAAPAEEKPSAAVMVEEPGQTAEAAALAAAALETTPEEPASGAEAPLPVEAAQPPSEPDEMLRNAAALLAHLDAGILVSRNEEAIFANRVLLDHLGYASLEELHAMGGLAHSLAVPAPPGSSIAEVTARDGHSVPMTARQQCVDWNDLPATLLILHPAPDGAGASADTRLAHYEAESRELNAILDTATDGVAVLDAAGHILTLNRSGEALFGYDQNEVIGEPFSLLFDAASRAIAEDYLEGLKTNAVRSLLNDGREVVGRARQGGLIPMFMTLGRVSSSGTDDKNLKFCALLRDMTHWKKVELELDEARQGAERASALKSDFLAKVSHEIRTPLNAILGFAEVIMDERFGPIGNERYKDYLKDIHMSGAHVMSLVNDLLDLSKIEAGKLELDFVPVDANRIISECVALMQPQANRERVIMRMSLAATLPPISADERSLRQIILNLLSNAVKFNEPGGQVIIATVLSDSGNAVIRIRDTGIGMSEEDIETALEPFRQLATARQTTGTGLGLPLTKALVEANHAFFSIKSKKTEGTLVEVTFPVMRVSA